MKKRIMNGMLICAATLLIFGCEKKAETKAETESTVVETETETETEKETYKTIGQEKEGGFSVKLKNSTGKDIIGVAVKLVENEQFPENMLASDDVFSANEERILFYEHNGNNTEETQQESNENDKLLTQGYDVQLTFSDGSTKVLHSFPFEDIKEGELCFEDEVAFLKYTNLSAKENVDTKNAELAVKQAEESEALAAAETEYSDYVEDNSWYEEDDGASWDNGGYVDDGASWDNGGSNEVYVPEAPAQGAEECLGDDALTY